MSTTRPSGRRPQRPTPAPVTGRPIQYTPFTPEHFKTPDGIAFVNQFLQQLVDQLNVSNGSIGKVALPHGLDVRGATISGLGAPQSESDAISSGHASSQFSAESLNPKLDVGGDNALKGLTYLFLQKYVNSLNGLGGAITILGDSTITVIVNGQNIQLHATGGGGGPINFADNELVTITAGSGTLAHTPNPPASVQLYAWNTGFGGTLLVQGAGRDYTLSGAHITLGGTAPPTVGEYRAFYRY